MQNTKRNINLHEYQSKILLRDHGLNTQKFVLASCASEAHEMASKLIASNPDVHELVIKAQVHAGGRGKGVFSNGFKSGIHLTEKITDVYEIASNMLGNSLITPQTGSSGVVVKKIMIAQALDIKKETYLGIVLDRSFGGVVVIGSPCGGMDIEKVAEICPEKIFKVPISIEDGPILENLIDLAKNMGFPSEELRKNAADQMIKLYNLFLSVDATQVEINPLGMTTDDRIVCFDAKITFDDNAMFRQAKLFNDLKIDNEFSDIREAQAAAANLNYIPIYGGNIGCLVNGAGLAMATMDIIAASGGKPANFLDVGGAASQESIATAMKLLIHDPNVKAILVNVFGGIVKCDVIARGILQSLDSTTTGHDKPLIVRLSGTNYNEGRFILKEASHKYQIFVTEDLKMAASNVIASLE